MIVEVTNLPTLTNYSYLIAGLYLLYNKYYFYGVLGCLVWFVSHRYHIEHPNNEEFDEKMTTDNIFCGVAFMTVILIHICAFFELTNIFLLLVLAFLFKISYVKYYKDIDKYYILHGIWHVYSALFVIYLIIFYDKFHIDLNN